MGDAPNDGTPQSAVGDAVGRNARAAFVLGETVKGQARMESVLWCENIWVSNVQIFLVLAIIIILHVYITRLI